MPKLTLFFTLVVYPGSILGQQDFHACEPPQERITFYQQTVKPAGARRVELLRAAMTKDPDDLFLNRWLLESPQVTVGSLREEYRIKLEEHTGNPRFLYFYARALMGADTPKAIEYLDRAKAVDPELLAAYLALMEVYASPNFKDSAKVAENIEAYSDRCPGDLSGYVYLTGVDDKPVVKMLAARFRKAAEGRNTMGVAAYYPRLWSAEFRAADPAEFEGLRKRVAADLKRVQELNPSNTRALLAGYKLVGDAVAVKALEEKAGQPGLDSTAARFHAAFSAWDKAHPWPKPASREAREKFYEERLQASEQWVKGFPDYTHAWYWRLVSLSAAKSTPAAEIEKAGEKVLQMDAKEPLPWTTVPYSYSVAEEWNRHDIRLKDCVRLAKQALAELDRFTATGLLGANDMRRAPVSSGLASSFAYTRFNAWRVEADASRKLKDFKEMRAVTVEMKKWLDENKGDNKSLEFDYWHQMGRLAQEQGRLLDALSFYRHALGRCLAEEVKERAQALWTELGGSKETFELWLEPRSS